MELIPGLPDDVARECLIRVPYASFCAAASACKLWMEEIQSREFRFSRRSNGCSQSVLVMAQARPGSAPSPGCPKLPLAPSYRLVTFDPVSGDWGELPPLPGCPDGIPMFCQLVAAGLDLVVVGGLDPVTWEASGSVYVYSFMSGGWRRGTNMPGVRRSFFACTSDGQRMVFVAGGHDREKNALRSAIAYDVATDRWLAMPNMAGERDECKGLFSNRKFLVLGGYPTESQGGFVKSAEEFDIASWQWSSPREDVLDSCASPTTCVAGTSDDSLYTCRDGDVLASSRTAWRVLSRLPAEAACPAHVTAWRGKVMVVGSARFGEPQVGYLLEVNKNDKVNSNTGRGKKRDNNWSGEGMIENNGSTSKCTWNRVEFQEEFSGHVQSGCLMEI